MTRWHPHPTPTDSTHTWLFSDFWPCGLLTLRTSELPSKKAVNPSAVWLIAPVTSWLRPSIVGYALFVAKQGNIAVVGCCKSVFIFSNVANSFAILYRQTQFPLSGQTGANWPICVRVPYQSIDWPTTWPNQSPMPMIFVDIPAHETFFVLTGFLKFQLFPSYCLPCSSKQDMFKLWCCYLHCWKLKVIVVCTLSIVGGRVHQ